MKILQKVNEANEKTKVINKSKKIKKSVSVTCRVELMFEGRRGFLILRLPVCGLPVENARSPKETKHQTLKVKV